MKKLLFVLAVFVAACSPSTKIEKTWRDPGTTINSGSYNKVLVAALLKNETTRRIVEDQLVQKLNGKGVASYNYYTEKEVTEEKATNFRDKLAAEGFDGAVVMRLVDIEKETNWVPNAPNFPPYYGRFGRYYYNSWNSFYNPGYYTTDKIYNVETNVYSIKQDKLIWSGLTSTVNPSKAEKMFNDIADVVSARMRQEGFMQ